MKGLTERLEKRRSDLRSLSWYEAGNRTCDLWSGKSDSDIWTGSSIWSGPAILERENGPAIPGLVYQPRDRRSDFSHTNPGITVSGNRTCDILIQGSQVRFPAYPSRDRRSDFQYQSRDRRSDFPLMLAPFRAQSPLHKIEKHFF